MTEITVRSDHHMPRDIRPRAFFAALLLAPLIVGIPALILIVLGSSIGGPFVLVLFPLAVIVVATVIGAPVYLIFGGPIFWMALSTGRSLPGSAFVANLLSLPFVMMFFALIDGNVGAALGYYAVLGSIFAPIWGAFFESLYAHFTGEQIDV